MTQYALWLCDSCGDNAEVEPGGRCEVCSQGTIHIVPVVPAAQHRNEVIKEVNQWLEQQRREAYLTASDEVQATVLARLSARFKSEFGTA